MQRRQQLHVPTRERYKENIPTYRRNRITLKSTRKYKCPNSTCRKTFASTVHVLQHLNHPRSSCYKWSQEAEYSIFGGREGAEQYLNGSRDVSNGPGPLASTSSAQSSCTEVPNAPTSPASPREELLPFPGAAQSVAGGTSFMNWMDEDVFAAQRTDNYYYPFANGDEWDFGRFLTTSSLRMREIDEFLKLPIVQKHLLPHLTFKSAKELRQRVELLPTGPRWVAQTIKYPGFPTKRPIVLFYRNSLDCAQLILRHPVLKKHIDLIPTLLTQGGERIHKEWINSDSAWQMQQAIPAGRTVLGIVASSDKTNISVMNGDRVAHPFLLSLANLHSEVASKASSNAFIMTALLPVPKFLCEKKLRGIMEKRLLHQCLDIICGPLKLAARDGAPLSTSDGGIIVAHTPLVSYIVDTPEAADLSGVKGKTSHLTMASHKTFGDAVRQPERTGASTWEAICSVTARVSPDDVAAYQKAAKAHPNRLSGVHLPFWRDWPLSTDPSKFLTPEVLHHIHKAFFDHDFQWGRTILGDAEIDFRLSLLHPRSGSRHFHDGVTRLKQLGGREHRELQRSFISIIAEAAPREVLCALRALMDFRFMAQAPQIDESTLIRMEALLAQFHELKHHIIEANGREQDHFNIPKLELLHSIVPSIRWAGVPMQYTADITEKAHSTQIKVPARTETNHRDYDPQIVRHLDRAEKLRLFTLYTNTRTEGLDLDLDDPGEEEDEEDASGSSLVGESNGRTMRNLFQAAVIYPTLYPGTETRFETTPSTAYLLNRRASLASISVEDVASMFAIPDLRAALGDYFSARGQRRSPLIGGRRRSQNDCVLPFTHLEIWYSVRVQTRAPHTGRPLPSRLIFAQPPIADTTWPVGRHDTVLLCDSLDTPWPGKGFREGLNDHTIAQLGIIFRPRWPAERVPASNPFLAYGYRLDTIPQPTLDRRDAITGQFLLRKSVRANNARMGDVFNLKHIRMPVELIPRFGKKADTRLTPYTSMEHTTELRLNKYSSKEFFWIHESITLPIA